MSNGQIPAWQLSYVRGEGFRADAAVQLRALESAFAAHFGYEFIINEGYRSLTTQQRLYRGWQLRLPGYNLAAYPGTSNHGWGLAGDFGSGIQSFGTPQKAWMDHWAPLYGWHPTGNRFSRPEAWHFDYLGNPSVVAGTAPIKITIPEPLEEAEEEMKTIQIHYVEGGKVQRALVTPGTGYFLDWHDNNADVANAFANRLETGSSIPMTKAMFEECKAAAVALRPK